ncbi:MAG: metalloenzyme [Anaerolineae bacterium]|nr:metalloenzyme [Anaerolineae bacterium]MDW8099150.1 metalloenzyme [Anaerolineae bacterium]
MARVCFVFLDGIGLGPATAVNPLASAPMPTLQSLLDRPLVAGPAIERPYLLLRPIDARLGVDGLPQSATGQTSLFTGINAARAIGRHLAAFPTAALREIIAHHSILKRVTENGGRATFANAYSPQYWELVRQRRLRHSATTWTNMAAGLRFRDLNDLLQGQAVYWDITHLIMHQRGITEVPLIEPEEAGCRLAGLTAEHDLVLYESFLPDLVGHRRLDMTPETAMALIDRFLSGLLANLPDDATLLLSSDHGNIEDMSTKAHTYNPVPLLAVGPDAAAFAEAQSITDVTPAILRLLNGRSYYSSSTELSPSQEG